MDVFLYTMCNVSRANVTYYKCGRQRWRKKKNDAETLQKLRRLLTPAQSDKLLISAMNGTFTNTEERRAPPEWCSRLQERSAEMDVTSSSVMLMKSVVFVCFFSFLFFASFLDSLHFRYLSAPGRVVSHSTATGLNYEKICRQSVRHIHHFSPISAGQEKQLKGTNCVKNSLSTSALFWTVFPSSLWIWQKQEDKIKS